MLSEQLCCFQLQVPMSSPQDGAFSMALLLVASKVGDVGGRLLSHHSLIMVCFEQSLVFPCGF